MYEILGYSNTGRILTHGSKRELDETPSPQVEARIWSDYNSKPFTLAGEAASIDIATINIIKASVGEASMMARCTGKTNLHNVEPEDLRAVTIATAAASGIPLVGKQS